MVDTSAKRDAKRSMMRAALRAAALAAVVLAALAAFRWTPLAELVDEQRLIALLDQLRESSWAGPVLIVLYIVISPLGIPISPLVLAGGAVFGLFVGWALNLLGALLGGAATFLIGQYMGRDLIVHLVGIKRLQRTEELLEQHGFWAIVRIRFLPIPYALVNYGAALAGVKFGPFLLATAIGLAPSLVIYTTLSYALVTATAEDRIGVAIAGALVIIGVVAITFIPAAWRALKNRKSRV
jgi:uncharacterized membrane protein YdjX (TVP38/TMEM64 family)